MVLFVSKQLQILYIWHEENFKKGIKCRKPTTYTGYTSVLHESMYLYVLNKINKKNRNFFREILLCIVALIEMIKMFDSEDKIDNGENYDVILEKSN